MFIGQAIRPHNGVVERRRGISLAGNFGGNPLEDFRRQVWIHQDGELGLPQHIDEARRRHHAPRVDGAPGRGLRQRADGGDASVADGNVPRVPGRSRPVDHVRVAYQDVIGLSVNTAKRQRQQGGEFSQAWQ